MPLIQRNLFPSRPPSKKNDGPSVLRAANSNNNNNNNVINNPNLTLYNKYNNNNNIKSDSSTATKISNKKQQQQENKNGKKLKKNQSASMISLLAIGPANNNEMLDVGRKNRNNIKINYDSQDSFNSSDASSSDPNSLCSSSSSVDNMISRRRILSRSRDALNSTSDDYSSAGFNPVLDEDVWFSKSKLISDHVDEIITKWSQIDDEIWAKVICMERNRRVAKAYARTPILTINGYDTGFDGHRIGLNGFNNPMRDRKTADIKKKIEDGIKIRMDENGSLLVKRIADVDVFLISFDKMDTFISEKIEPRKSIVLFDMKQYQNELLKEIKSASPNPRALEQKCFCFISFATIADDILNTPVWCIIINLVALEMLVKLLPNRLSEDDFYSLPISLSAKSNGYGPYMRSPLPPKLPPRDLHNKKPPLTLPEPDYEDDNHEQHVIPYKQNNNLNYDDPYYHGLSAHVPKFAHSERHQQSNNLIMVNPRVHPPIIRKAMNKKLWHHPPNNPHFQPFSPMNDFENYRSFPGCFVSRTSSSSTFDPMSLIPTMVPPQPPPPPPMRVDHSSINNDNNEIYGVNPLLRKNTQFCLKSNNNSSSLKNIFSRKKSNKDHNNNPRKH